MSLADFPRFVPWANVALVIAILLTSVAFLFGRVPPDRKDAQPPADTTTIESWKFLPPQKITDSAGRTAQIQTLVTSVASRELNWVLNKNDAIERLGEPASIVPHLQSPGISSRLQGYKAIIAIGAASEELNPAAPSSAAAIAEEEDRARKRAIQLRLWIHETYTRPPPVMWLSLGVRKVETATQESTANQRMLILLGVIDAQPGIDFTSALKNNLKTDQSFPLRLREYTKFELGDTWAN